MSAYDKTSIQINRCKRILALVDDYVTKMNAGARTTLRMALMEEFEAPAIAPPVAAGSVDTLQRFELVESQHGTGYMVHWDKALEKDVDGEWVKHVDVNAWAAQHVANAIKDQMERAEKAETRVTALEAAICNARNYEIPCGADNLLEDALKD